MSLLDAVSRGDLEGLRAALEAGCDPDPLDAEGCTPLMRAAQKGRVDLLASLLESGADPRIEDGLGETALIKAATFGNVDAYAMLVRYCRSDDERQLAETMLRTAGTTEIPRPEDVTPDSKWAWRLAAAGAKLGSWFDNDDASRRLARAVRAQKPGR